MTASAAIEDLRVGAFSVPTEAPESDGTLEWDNVTAIVVEASCDGATGLGYTYSHPACAYLIDTKLRGIVADADPRAPRRTWAAMHAAVRNLGHGGLTMMAVSAVDIALWDLKARLLEVSLVDLLGVTRPSIPVYGSGGFTSYDVGELCEQLAAWAEAGMQRVKMKVGREPAADRRRVAAAREAVDDHVELFVDANGAYSVKQAVELGEAFAEYDVSWFEEPVSSQDLKGLRFVREHAPPQVEVSAGEYGSDLPDFGALIEIGAIDVLQADVGRCGGITAFMRIDSLCRGAWLPLSTHGAPQISAHAAAAAAGVRHVEYFHDHVLIEDLLFDGVLRPQEGAFHPDRGRPGSGLSLKPDADRYRTYGGTEWF